MHIAMAPIYRESANEIYSKFALYKHALIMNNLIDTELGDALEDLTQEYCDLVFELLSKFEKVEEEQFRNLATTQDNSDEKVIRLQRKDLD